MLKRIIVWQLIYVDIKFQSISLKFSKIKLNLFWEIIKYIIFF